MGTKIVNKLFVNKLAFPSFVSSSEIFTEVLQLGCASPELLPLMTSPFGLDLLLSDHQQERVSEETKGGG